MFWVLHHQISNFMSSEHKWWVHRVCRLMQAFRSAGHSRGAVLWNSEFNLKKYMHILYRIYTHGSLKQGTLGTKISYASISLCVYRYYTGHWGRRRRGQHHPEEACNLLATNCPPPHKQAPACDQTGRVKSVRRGTTGVGTEHPNLGETKQQPSNFSW